MASAERIVDAVLDDLSGRKGVGDELDAIEPAVMAELKADLAQIVRAELAK